MGLAGKYDFRGIKKTGAAGVRIALAASPYTAWALKFGFLLDLVLEFGINWLANRGLLVLNIGAITVGGELDQRALDSALDKAFDEITARGGRDKLTPAQKKAIDDEVIKAARRALRIGNT